MKVDTFTYGLGENSVLVVNRAIVHGIRDAGILRYNHSPDLDKGSVDWTGVSKMKDKVTAGADVAMCQAGVSLEVMNRLKEAAPSTRIFLQRDSSHAQEWHDQVHQEMERFGIHWTAYGDGLLQRETEEYRLADRITVLSRWVQSTFEKHGLGDKALYVGPQTFDLAKWPHRPPVGGGVFKVLFAGQTGFRKGLWYLLEAWRRLRLADAQLVIAGVSEPAGDSANELNSWINQQVKDTPACTALGFVPLAKMANLYAECDVLCLPSVEEGSSMTVLEAMAVGRPVIASTHAGADILRHGENGFLVEPRSWEQIADSIDWYHGNRVVWREHCEEAARSVRGLDVPDFGRRYVERMTEAYKQMEGD